ncbi:MAG: hypothetical protein KDC73_06490 [Ignavibacteriae bacterium]|nr:hypothetical protein [Ignavibacteriota bacterium]MCB9243622.1 hypothetical protein [Ignavibacteriales bacterium]
MKILTTKTLRTQRFTKTTIMEWQHFETAVLLEEYWWSAQFINPRPDLIPWWSGGSLNYKFSVCQCSVY